MRPEVQPRDSCHKADPVVKPEDGFRSEGKAEELCGTCGEDRTGCHQRRELSRGARRYQQRGKGKESMDHKSKI